MNLNFLMGKSKCKLSINISASLEPNTKDLRKAGSVEGLRGPLFYFCSQTCDFVVIFK